MPAASQSAASSRAKNPPPIILAKLSPKSRKRTVAKARSAKKPNDLTRLRDALPFFKSGGRKGEASWWNVTPSGDYAADMETGKAYARAFLPMMVFNSGAAMLAYIVSDMAVAGRDPAKNPKNDRRGVDDIALGFLHEIGNTIQAAIGSIATATVALKGRKNSRLRSDFVKTVESKGVMHMLRMNSRSTLYHDPGATLFAELVSR